MKMKKIKFMKLFFFKCWKIYIFSFRFKFGSTKNWLGIAYAQFMAWTPQCQALHRQPGLSGVAVDSEGRGGAVEGDGVRRGVLLVHVIVQDFEERVPLEAARLMDDRLYHTRPRLGVALNRRQPRQQGTVICRGETG